jgi:hypothetical protein
LAAWSANTERSASPGDVGLWLGNDARIKALAAALAGLSEATYAAFKQWPLPATGEQQDSRFFGKGGFFTPDPEGALRRDAVPTYRRKNQPAPALSTQYRPHPGSMAHHDPHRPCAPPDDTALVFMKVSGRLRSDRSDYRGDLLIRAQRVDVPTRRLDLAGSGANSRSGAYFLPTTIVRGIKPGCFALMTSSKAVISKLRVNGKTTPEIWFAVFAALDLAALMLPI